MVVLLAASGARLVAAAGLLVDGGPGAGLRDLLGSAAFFVAFGDVFGLALLLVGIAALVALRHVMLLSHLSPTNRLVAANGSPAPSATASNRLHGATMARPKPSTFDKVKTVAENRRARFDYFIDEKFEAGIALSGTEVKSLRSGEGTIAESYAEVRGGEAWLINANIPEFSHGN